MGADLQNLVDLIYPPQCVICDALTDHGQGLCPECWRDTPFVLGLVCDACGAPLPGQPGEIAHCDDCLERPRPWDRGRAALVYQGRARDLVLAYKHADRLDIAGPAAEWMRRAGAELLHPGVSLVPMPSHWTRRLRRRGNQAALLARRLGRLTGLPCYPLALSRARRTPVLDGRGAEERFRLLDAAIRPGPEAARFAPGAEVVLIDDVMTSGASLAAATAACLGAGAGRVSVLTLARVCRLP